MICPKCGKELEDDAQFCSRCGAALKEESLEDVTAGITTKIPVGKGGGLLLGVIIGLAAAAVFVALVVAVLAGSGVLSQ